MRSIAAEVPAGKVLLPLAVWLARRDELAVRADAGEIGVWLDSHEGPEAKAWPATSNRLARDRRQFPEVHRRPRLLERPSAARALWLPRARLRALGDVLQDQLFFMHRCGFDAYAVARRQGHRALLAALRDFSDAYQAVDRPTASAIPSPRGRGQEAA
jgi:uncharacterized protein (DUF934 family)